MKTLIAMTLALLLPLAAVAQEKAEEGPPKVAYYALSPPLVGNYGLDGGQRLHVYKADISLKVTGAEAEKAVKLHEPLIRNQLVALFNQQSVEAMGSVEAKEKLRQDALKQTQDALQQEEGKPIVEDLLFNNLIVQ